MIQYRYLLRASAAFRNKRSAVRMDSVKAGPCWTTWSTYLLLTSFSRWTLCLYTSIVSRFRSGIVRSKMYILTLFTHSYVFPNWCDFLFSVIKEDIFRNVYNYLCIPILLDPTDFDCMAKTQWTILQNILFCVPLMKVSNIGLVPEK